MRNGSMLGGWLALAAVTVASAAGIDYPKSRDGGVVTEIHGRSVSDPFRWLEDDVRTSDDVRNWVEAQNKVTFAYLNAIPGRDAIRARLEQIWNYERYSSPFKLGGRYFYFKNDGLQNQSVLYALDGLEAEPRVVLDPNQWSEDGTVALAGLSMSLDGRYLAYAKAAAGSDWQEWFVRDMQSGSDLADRLQWTKFTGASWTVDGKGFFYGRFDAPPQGQEFQALNTGQKVYFHRAGTAQSEDVLVYERPDQPEWGFGTSTSEDGSYLILSVWKGTDPRNRLLVKDLREPYAMPVELVDSFDHGFSFIGNDGPLLYLKTDHGAPNQRVIAMDIRRPQVEHWREVIPEANEPLRSVSLVGNVFIANYLKDVVSQFRIFKIDGTHVRDIALPGKGSADGFGGLRTDTETFYSYSSLNTPPRIYRYDILSGESRLWRQAQVDFDPDQYVVSQVFYKSKDGTRIPMFLAHKKGIPIDGNRPTLLFGYGGFNVTLTPSFSVSRLAWMEMGGVFAMANLRGGGEYGKAWHDAGKQANKQNVFDDFIAAAEWLIDNDYTSSKKLAIQGGSNGGLLVGACMTQRPELFGAALPAVGVMDMLRFHKFTAGRYWVDDYGSAEDAEQFKTLLAYSPYHNLKPNTAYPATLITTADTDDRVVPGHSFKFAAALQKAHRGESPVLIRIETRAGHGGGKPTSMLIDEVADSWAFLVKTLGIELPVVPDGSS